MVVEMFSWPSLHENMCRAWGSNSWPLACQAETLPIELPRPAIRDWESLRVLAFGYDSLVWMKSVQNCLYPVRTWAELVRTNENIILQRIFAYISALYEHYYLNVSTVWVRHDITGVNGINKVNLLLYGILFYLQDFIKLNRQAFFFLLPHKDLCKCIIFLSSIFVCWTDSIINTKNV